MNISTQGIAPIVVPDAKLLKNDDKQSNISQDGEKSPPVVGNRGSNNRDSQSLAPNFALLSEKAKDLFDDGSLIKFAIDEDSQKFVIKVLDGETEEVVMQLPAEQSLKIARFVAEQLEDTRGQVTDAKV